MDPETLIIALRKNAVLVVMHVVLGAIIGIVFAGAVHLHRQCESGCGEQ